MTTVYIYIIHTVIQKSGPPSRSSQPKAIQVGDFMEQLKESCWNYDGACRPSWIQPKNIPWNVEEGVSDIRVGGHQKWIGAIMSGGVLIKLIC
ncbi:hypothetical protein GDO78_023296 [Eleutherodactylus coqui]|uniref:Uncharacterized protein n=1 Tax=Eleutherodactylus coqui TaxID=57060 RepID=A0A8J6BFN0_ELECQ|nr:hypothetical protein GDO78_023296 [Eleutherodactylus coqui]